LFKDLDANEGDRLGNSNTIAFFYAGILMRDFGNDGGKDF